MFKGVQISLANKCQLLFGAAVLLILTAGLTVVSWRMQALVDRASRNNAQETAEAWLADQIQLSGGLTPVDNAVGALRPNQERAISLIDAADFPRGRDRDAFLDRAIQRFRADHDKQEIYRKATDARDQPYLRYARAIRVSDQERMAAISAMPPEQPDALPQADAPEAHDSAVDPREAETSLPEADASPEPGTTAAPKRDDPLTSLLLINLRDRDAAAQQTINYLYIAAAGLFAGLLAIGVFWFITRRIILSPVRLLRGYAEKVSEGDLNIRSDINTGDEFEALSKMFNNMLDTIKESQDRLRGVNKSLDLKLGEMAESNVALYEANKMKGEFLANVSHELRTPLNSIVGFAEVLQETLADRTGPVDEKRKRYAQNIITSSRRLLELINDLLDLAKIEAGRMELRTTQVSVVDLAEGLMTLMKPQAQKRDIELSVRVEPNLPLIETDAGKLQQILFNFLSNAVKFTPEGGRVTLIASYHPEEGAGGGGHAGADDGEPAVPVGPRVRLTVTDTGPGVPEAERERIFEKFTQLDRGVTRSHEGTGLGLTISRELAQMLQGRIDLESDEGRGARFILVLPLQPGATGKPLMPEAAPS